MSHDKLPNRYEYWNPWNLCYKFFAEAERLWELETASRRVQLTSIQAGLLLDLVRRMHAMEALRRPYSYMEQAVEMAKKIRLFDSDSDTMSAKADVKTTRARQFSAWGVFNYQR
jgi:predicted nucleic acid-binding protein